jgi:hypothetical protein
MNKDEERAAMLTADAVTHEIVRLQVRTAELKANYAELEVLHKRRILESQAMEEDFHRVDRSAERLWFENERLREALRDVRQSILDNATDTVWINDIETVVDYISSVLAEPALEPSNGS